MSVLDTYKTKTVMIVSYKRAAFLKLNFQLTMYNIFCLIDFVRTPRQIKTISLVKTRL